MSLSAAERAQIVARIAKKQSQLDLANETFDKLLAKDIEEYRFDSNEGSQRARRVQLKMFRDVIDSLEASIDRETRRLRRGGIVNLILRR